MLFSILIKSFSALSVPCICPSNYCSGYNISVGDEVRTCYSVQSIDEITEYGGIFVKDNYELNLSTNATIFVSASGSTFTVKNSKSLFMMDDDKFFTFHFSDHLHKSCTEFFSLIGSFTRIYTSHDAIYHLSTEVSSDYALAFVSSSDNFTMNQNDLTMNFHKKGNITRYHIESNMSSCTPAGNGISEPPIKLKGRFIDIADDDNFYETRTDCICPNNDCSSSTAKYNNRILYCDPVSSIEEFMDRGAIFVEGTYNLNGSLNSEILLFAKTTFKALNYQTLLTYSSSEGVHFNLNTHHHDSCWDFDNYEDPLSLIVSSGQKTNLSIEIANDFSLGFVTSTKVLNLASNTLQLNFVNSGRLSGFVNSDYSSGSFEQCSTDVKSYSSSPTIKVLGTLLNPQAFGKLIDFKFYCICPNSQCPIDSMCTIPVSSIDDIIDSGLIYAQGNYQLNLVRSAVIGIKSSNSKITVKNSKTLLIDNTNKYMSFFNVPPKSLGKEKGYNEVKIVMDTYSDFTIESNGNYSLILHTTSKVIDLNGAYVTIDFKEKGALIGYLGVTEEPLQLLSSFQGFSSTPTITIKGSISNEEELFYFVRTSYFNVGELIIAIVVLLLLIAGVVALIICIRRRIAKKAEVTSTALLAQ